MKKEKEKKESPENIEIYQKPVKFVNSIFGPKIKSYIEFLNKKNEIYIFSTISGISSYKLQNYEERLFGKSIKTEEARTIKGVQIKTEDFKRSIEELEKSRTKFVNYMKTIENIIQRECKPQIQYTNNLLKGNLKKILSLLN